MAKRVSTGIAELDSMISGGFRKDSTSLILGGPGTGKTILAMQFLAAGILKYNEPGIYLSFEEESKEEIYDTMLKFGWDFAKWEKQGKFSYLQYTPEQIEKIIERGAGTLKDAIQEIKAKRLVIDSITEFELLQKSELAERESCLKLFRFIEGWDCTTLAIAEHEALKEKPTVEVIEFEVDGIILLYHKVEDGARKRALEVLKLRDVKHSNKIVRMDITNKGIKINPEQIVIF